MIFTANVWVKRQSTVSKASGWLSEQRMECDAIWTICYVRAPCEPVFKFSISLFYVAYSLTRFSDAPLLLNRFVIWTVSVTGLFVTHYH